MKVRISYTVDVPDEWRREINVFYGDDGLASRDDVKSWYRKYGESMDDDLANGLEEEAPAGDDPHWSERTDRKLDAERIAG